MEYLFSFLIQYYPQIAVYGIILFLVVVITIKATDFYSQTRRLHADMPTVQTTLTKIDTGLTLLNNVLLEKTIISQSCYSNGNSPRVISSLGIQLLNESGANPIFEAIKGEFVMELEAKTINSLLELEKESLNVMLVHRDEARFKPLQDFAYQHPTFNDMPLTYTDLLFVVALKLRDFYRTRHPDLTAEQ